MYLKKNKFFILVILLFEYSCMNPTFTGDIDKSPAEFFHNMKEKTPYLCNCMESDSLITWDISFIKSKSSENFYYIDFNTPHSKKDTILLTNKEVYLVKKNKIDSSDLIFDFNKKKLFKHKIIDFNSGLGIDMSLRNIYNNIYEYSFDGVSPHSQFISSIKVKYDIGILEFIWYDGIKKYNCRLIR